MSFESTSGTRGARQPGGWPVKLVNKLVMLRMRRAGSTGMGQMKTLVLTTVGRRSGEKRSSPVAWFPADGDGWLVVASAGGAAKNPAWYHNIAAHPDQVEVEVGGRRIEVTARQLGADERAEAWTRITAAAPRFASYQQSTDREIPVIALTSRSA